MVYSKGLHCHDVRSRIILETCGIPQVHQNFLAPPKDPYNRPRQPTDCQRSETWTLTKYIAGTFSWAADDMLVSESNTGRVHRARPPGKHLSAQVHGPQTLLDTFEPTPRPLFGGGPASSSWTPASFVFCPYCLFKKAPRPRRTFYGTVCKTQLSRNA